MKGAPVCAIACLLAGCNDEQDLDGTWYSQIRSGAVVRYAGERIIVQDGSHVVIRDCTVDPPRAAGS